MNARERIDRTLAIHAELREIWEAGDVFNVHLAIFPSSDAYNEIDLEETITGTNILIHVKELEIRGRNFDRTRVTFHRPQ